MRFHFIHKHRTDYQVKIMCRILSVSRQGYYEWRKRKPSQLRLRHRFLEKEIRRVYDQHKGRYGSPRIALQLYDEGIETNKRVVATLMRKMGLCAKGYHRRKTTYGQDKSFETAYKENLLERQFDQEIIDKIWVTDITYVSCSDGRLYLSTYIDLATRIPRCFTIETHMRKEIVLNPIKSYKNQLPDIIHSDRGSQYRSYAYQDLLESYKIRHSMSQPGTPVDNAVIESFHRTIKRELIIPNKGKTKEEMKVLIFNYLTEYFPNERIHMKFKMTPSQYEKSLRESLNSK